VVAVDENSRLDTVSVNDGNERLAPLQLTWDVAGRLSATSDGATYVYDAKRRRVSLTVAGKTTLYHYDVAGRVIA